MLHILALNFLKFWVTKRGKEKGERETNRTTTRRSQSSLSHYQNTLIKEAKHMLGYKSKSWVEGGVQKRKWNISLCVNDHIYYHYYHIITFLIAGMWAWWIELVHSLTHLANNGCCSLRFTGKMWGGDVYFRFVIEGKQLKIRWIWIVHVGDVQLKCACLCMRLVEMIFTILNRLYCSSSYSLWMGFKKESFCEICDLQFHIDFCMTFSI